MDSFNPYADQLNFPPGTPWSVVNMILQMNQRNAALRSQQDQQPKWWETGINNLAQGVTGNLIMPWLSNEFVKGPYEQGMDTFRTDNNIRQSIETGNASMNREQQMLDYKQAALDAENAGLGQSAGEFANIANTPGPSVNQDYTVGGGVNPYGPYEDPWATGTIPLSNQMERPPGQNAAVGQTDEMGNMLGNASEQRQPDTITQPTDSGQANIFTTTPGKKPSSSEVIAQMAAKYPTLDIGRLLKFMGPTPTSSMLDVNKIDAQQATIDLKNAQAAKDRAAIDRENQLLDAKRANIESQTGLRNAQAGRTTADTMRIEVMAKSEQGRQDILQYIQDHPEMDEEEKQTYLAIVQRAQLRETPTQQADRTANNARIMAGRPTPSTQLDEQTRLEIKEANGTISPDEQVMLNALRQNRRVNPQPGEGKPESPVDAYMRQLFEKKGMIPPRSGPLTGPGGMPMHPNTPPPPSTAVSPYDRWKK